MFQLSVVRLETLNIGALQRAIKIGAVGKIGALREDTQECLTYINKLVQVRHL